MTDPSGVPERLRKARVVSEMSRAQVAQALDLHEHTLANWESGKNDIPLQKALALCDLYGMTISELVGDTTEEETLVGLKEVGKRLAELEAGIDALRRGTTDS